MKMHVEYYIDSDQVEVTVTKSDRYESYKIGKTSIRLDAGQPVLTVDDGRWKEPPNELVDKIMRVSIGNNYFSYDFDRAPGMYRLGEAEGYVERHMNLENGVGIRVKVSAQTKEEAVVLWDAIMCGNIRPEEEHLRSQIEVQTNEEVLQEVRQQAALLVRKLLKEAMEELSAEA